MLIMAPYPLLDSYILNEYRFVGLGMDDLAPRR